MTKLEATSRVQILRLNQTDDELCKKLGISKPTMYVRLKTHNWKITELSHIEKLKL